MSKWLNPGMRQKDECMRDFFLRLLNDADRVFLTIRLCTLAVISFFAQSAIWNEGLLDTPVSED